MPSENTEMPKTGDGLPSAAVINSQGARTYGVPIMSGWRLWMVIFSLCSAMFLSALETTIIATALVTIASDLGHFEKSSWIVVSYLITYTGFLVIISRMSDIFGRKQALLVSLAFFTIWSAACGWATTVEQLALQGMGGSGLYALATSVVPEITPAEKLGHAVGAVSSVGAFSSVLGPLIGGVITSHTTWRWVFWLNIPAGVVVTALVILIFPKNIGQMRHSKALYKMIDWPGAVISLVGSVTLVFALESGGIQYPWKSGPIISTFLIAGVSWMLFPLWESYLTTRASKTSMLPIFPARLLSHRIIASSLVTAFFTGFPFMATIFILPQRFQIVNGLSPAAAGVRMLPFSLLTPVGAAFTGKVCAKKNLSFYLLAFSSALQIVGIALLSTLPVTQAIPASQYGIQVLLGFAFGVSLTSLLIVSRVEVEPEDHAVAMGAITQVRVLGGIIGLAVLQAFLLASLKSRLIGHLNPQQLAGILASAGSISKLPPEVAEMTRRVYGEVANKQFQIVLGFTAAALVASLCAWRRHAIEFSDVMRERPSPPMDLEVATRVELVRHKQTSGSGET